MEHNLEDIKFGGLILSRIDSSRLPNKARLLLNGTRLIEHVIQGVKDNEMPIVLCTSERKIDDPLIKIAEYNNVKLFRGSLENVYLRMVEASQENGFDYIFRFNGDSPVVLKELISIAKKLVIKDNSIDIVSNIISRSFPYGISLELIKVSTFLNLYSDNLTRNHLEHPTKILYENLDKLNYRSIKLSKDFSAHRFVIDTHDDLESMQEKIKLENFGLPYEFKDLLNNVIIN